MDGKIANRTDEITEEEWLEINKTNRDMVQDYLDNQSDLSVKTRPAYRSGLRIFFKYVHDYLGDKDFTQIKKKEFQKYYYTTDMMYETGCMCNWSPEIAECPNESQFQYAIIDKNEKLIGYLGYSVNWYASKAYNFGLFSFDRGNILVGRDVFDKLEEGEIYKNVFTRTSKHCLAE